MEKLETVVLPYLFFVLFGFIFLNLVMNLCLYSFSKIKNVKVLCWYWLSLLFTYAFQALFQDNQLGIVLSYSSNVIPAVLMTTILFDTMGKEQPVKLFFKVWLLALFLTPILHFSGFSFTTVAMPLSLAMALVPMATAYELLVLEKSKTTRLQKFTGFLLVMAGIHFINFAIFRMGQGNQLWGWAIAFGLYQVFSVILFALVLENQAKVENDRLQDLVNIKTLELTKALHMKETLFRMVLHDIATPIQAQMLIVSQMEKHKDKEEKWKLLSKFEELTEIIRKVIEQVRSIEAKSAGTLNMNLSPVNFENCLHQIKTIFENQLQNKNLSLRVINELEKGTMFFADQTIFTTSVLGNLISNAIKFSPPNSELTLHTYEKNNKVMIEIIDQGVGIPDELAYSIFDPTKRHTRRGTNGEQGSGFGMAQVKSYVDIFGGEINVSSRPMELFPSEHGTRITLTLDKSSSGHLH